MTESAVSLVPDVSLNEKQPWEDGMRSQRAAGEGVPNSLSFCGSLKITLQLFTRHRVKDTGCLILFHPEGRKELLARQTKDKAFC